MKPSILWAVVLVCFLPKHALTSTFPPTSDAFDQIQIGGSQLYRAAKPTRSLTITKQQILMDRLGISPGVIDGQDTKRFQNARATWAEIRNEEPLPSTEAELDALLEKYGGAAFQTYEITAADIAGPFRTNIPERYVDQAELPDLGYSSIVEMLAERFHTDQAYLIEMNQGIDFEKIGASIKVPSIGRDLQKPVARIEADKNNLLVRAYDAKGALIASYPASIGSTSTPSPSGTHKVKNKAQDPVYTYDPNGSAQPGQSKGLVRLPPGPNSPVGNAWIGLSKKTYGIHGTPEPSNIGVTASVGCVRLTNWDALELARLVRTGIDVTFIE